MDSSGRELPFLRPSTHRSVLVLSPALYSMNAFMPALPLLVVPPYACTARRLPMPVAVCAYALNFIVLPCLRVATCNTCTVGRRTVRLDGEHVPYATGLLGWCACLPACHCGFAVDVQLFWRVRTFCDEYRWCVRLPRCVTALHKHCPAGLPLQVINYCCMQRVYFTGAARTYVYYVVVLRFSYSTVHFCRFTVTPLPAGSLSFVRAACYAHASTAQRHDACLPTFAPQQRCRTASGSCALPSCPAFGMFSIPRYTAHGAQTCSTPLFSRV